MRQALLRLGPTSRSARLGQAQHWRSLSTDSEEPKKEDAIAVPEAAVEDAPALKHKHSRRVPRKIRGGHTATLGPQMESWPESDFKDSLYNIRELVAPVDVPNEPGPFATKMWDPALLDKIAPSFKEEEAPYAGATKFMHWSVRYILQAGESQQHPLNRKVECTMKLAAIQKEYQLGEAGMRFIKAVCGPRYCPASDTLRLVSQKYAEREDNRRDIMRIVGELIEAGRAEEALLGGAGGAGGGEARKKGDAGGVTTKREGQAGAGQSLASAASS